MAASKATKPATLRDATLRDLPAKADPKGGLRGTTSFVVTVTRQN